MRSVFSMRFAKSGYMVISVLFCILGVLLIAVPEFSALLLGRICGAILIAFGIVKLVGYFSKDLYRLAFQYDLSLGIIMIAVGVLMLAKPGSLVMFICITFGLSILADSVFKFEMSLQSKKFGIEKWWLILIFSVITGIFGLILMFRPGEGSHILAVILGITFLCEGVLNISTMLTAVKIIKNQKPDVIEIDE